MQGRWKQGPNGAYYDPNDTGPNQVEPPQRAQPGPGGQFDDQSQLGSPKAQATQQAVAGSMPVAQGGLGDPQPPQAQATQNAVAGPPQDEAPAMPTPQRDAKAAQIKAWYQQYLGRDASDAEVATHSRNPYGMDAVLQTIRGSQEAATRNGQAAPQLAPAATQDEQITAWYQAYLGRTPSREELNAHLRNPNGMNAVHETIRGSNEAAARRTGQGATTAPPTAPAATNAANPNWRTGGYAAPQYTAQRPGAVPAGWDATKWNDPNHQSPKYVAGRILSQYPPTVEGAKAAAAEIAKAYPGTTFNGKDMLTIPGVGAVDILRGASVGGQGWQWGAQDGPAAAASGSPQGVYGAATPPPLHQMNQAWLQQLLASLGVRF